MSIGIQPSYAEKLTNDKKQKMQRSKGSNNWWNTIKTRWKSQKKIWKVWQKACESKLFHSEWRLYRKPFIGVVLWMSQVDDFEVMKRDMRGGISWNPEILFRFIGILMAFYNPYNKRYCICILCFTKNIFFFWQTNQKNQKKRLQKNCHLIFKEGASKGDSASFLYGLVS